ncbi:MAG TPA: DUF4339 domain-containing protein [Candidatus Baltobacteraceae bacterium]|nr:DUF4339 domain-containing protein [Candidatus Baltobacteraceae bacterium]
MASDGNEHGPLSFEQVRQWISEKRVEKKTPVFPDGASDWMFLESLPEFSVIFNPPPPPTIVAPPPSASANNSLNVIIPYKNVRALVAYYLGVFSVIPILGMPLGIAGFVLGILGLRFRRKNPAAGGAVHAWIGIIFGGLFGLLWLALTIMAIVGILHARNNH